MLHNELCDVLEQSIRTVAWFALGEAIRLAQDLIKICAEYRKHPKNKVCQAKLIEAADRTYEFLQRMNGPNVQTVADNLKRLMTQIKLETPQ